MYKVNGSCDLVDYDNNDFADRPIVTEELLNVAEKNSGFIWKRSRA